jgi:hypothetical protein
MSLNPKILDVVRKNVDKDNYYRFFEKILYKESERAEIGSDRNKLNKFYKKIINESLEE